MSEKQVLRSIAPATDWWVLYKYENRMVVEPLAAWAGMEYPGGSQWIKGLSADETEINTDSEEFCGYYRSVEVPEKGKLIPQRLVHCDRNPPDDWFQDG